MQRVPNLWRVVEQINLCCETANNFKLTFYCHSDNIPTDNKKTFKLIREIRKENKCGRLYLSHLFVCLPMEVFFMPLNESSETEKEE